MDQLENVATKGNESKMETAILITAITVPLLCIFLKFSVFFYVYLQRTEKNPGEPNNIENNAASTKEDDDFEINIEKTLPPSPQLNVTSLAMKSMEDIDGSETQTEGMYGNGIDNQMETKGRNSVEMIKK
eukprot:181160_1